MIEPPPNGSVIEYPYLSSAQDRRGETEGRKDRPVCLALSVRSPATGEHHLILLAISSKPPSAGQAAMAIPEIERRRAGLTRYPSARIVTSEYNYDVLERSHYFDAMGRVFGLFSTRFMAKVAAELRDRLRNSGGRVSRID